MDALLAIVYSLLAIGVGIIIGECVYRLTAGFMPNPEPRFNDDSEVDSEEALQSSNC